MQLRSVSGAAAGTQGWHVQGPGQCCPEDNFLSGWDCLSLSHKDPEGSTGTAEGPQSLALGSSRARLCTFGSLVYRVPFPAPSIGVLTPQMLSKEH